jgi:NTE family protein
MARHWASNNNGREQIMRNGARIGLAFSGGGSRAIAFQLGCMKALQECKLLADIDVISSVSGGSVLAALYCSRDDDFASFEMRTKRMLREGLMGRIYASMFSWEGISALLSSAVALPLAIVTGLARAIAIAAARNWAEKAKASGLFRGVVHRWRTRTDVFERALRAKSLFGRLLMRDLPAGKPQLVINAADLRTQTAFRFTRARAGSWRSGAVAGYDFRLSEAVAASAAFPVLLPAIDRSFHFTSEGKEQRRRVLLTDGGVYDNLGVQVFDRNRPAKYAFALEAVDVVIACVAEPGLPSGEDLPQFWAARLRTAFSTVHRQLHVSGFATLHAWRASGVIKRLIMPYFGQDDTKLPDVQGIPRPAPLGALKDYPVDFDAMPEDAIEGISRRGYEQTRWLLKAYMADDGLEWRA